MKNKITIFIVGGILIISIILIIKYNNQQNLTNNPQPEEQDIILYNQILSESKGIEDVKNCKKIHNKEFEDICISAVEEKFDPMRKATTIEDCKKLSDFRTDSKEKRIDTCIYNIAIKNAQSQKDTKMCDEIQDKEIKLYCTSSIESKFDDMSKVTTFEWCDVLEWTKKESKEFRQDVCRYNRMKAVVDAGNYEELCKKIQTPDIQEICLLEYKMKFQK